MRLTDKPDNPENTIISIEPCQNKDGAPQLAITIYQATGSEQRTPKQMSRVRNEQDGAMQTFAEAAAALEAGAHVQQ